MRQFDFVKNRKIFFTLSLLILLSFLVLFFINGIVLDVTFKGGTRLLIESEQEIDANKASQLLDQAVSGRKITASIMKTFSSDTNNASVIMLRIDVAGLEPLTEEEQQAVRDVLKANFPVKLDSKKNQESNINPSIGKEALEKGLLAVVISSGLILLYVAWRFSIMSGFSAAVCAIIALLHDVGMMLGVYVAFKMPFNDVFIAAILTVIGYSINDTIIIYDRIRENANNMKKSDLASIVNVSIWQTLSRSINTLVTTLISIVTLFVFSSMNSITTLKDFSFSLIIGVTTGGYSSIFIAATLWLVLRQNRLKAQLSKS